MEKKSCGKFLCLKWCMVFVLFVSVQLQAFVLTDDIKYYANDLSHYNSVPGYLNAGKYRAYKYTPSEDGTISVKTVRSLDTYGYFYFPNGEVIESDDIETGVNNNFAFNDIQVLQGETYYIVVTGYDETVKGSFGIVLTFQPKSSDTSSSNDSCNFPYHLSSEVRPYLATCEQKWNYIRYWRVEKYKLFLQGDLIESQIYGIDKSRHFYDNVENIMGNALEIISLTKAFSISSDAAKEELNKMVYPNISRYLLPGGTDDSQVAIWFKGILDTWFDVGVAIAEGRAGASMVASQITKLFFTTQRFWQAFSLDDLTEQMNSVNIAVSFLDEYYGKGSSDFSDMLYKYTGSYYGTLDELVDAFANDQGYYNTWYGDDYHHNKIVQYIEMTINSVNNY